MNFLDANAKILAVCGRHSVYLYPMQTIAINFPAAIVSKRTFNILELQEDIPQGKRIGTKFCIVTVAVAENGKYVAVSDTAKNVYVYEDTGTGWECFSAWEMEKRVTRIIFDKMTTFVVMTDKTGDVWLSYMSLKLIQKPRKILGHSSYILDMSVGEDNDKILTCDRDEKIRISRFPHSHIIDEFKLGHTSAVVNVAVVNRGHNLLSMSTDGTLKLWKLSDRKELMSWNIFTQMQEKERKGREVKNEVVRMKATNTVGTYHVAVMIAGFFIMPVFELDGVRKRIRLCAHIQLDCQMCDYGWAKQSLFVYTPGINMIKRYYVSDFGISADPQTTFFYHTSTRLDMQGFAEYYRPHNIMKSRVAEEAIDTVVCARSALITEYGRMTEDENAPRAVLPRSPPNSEEDLAAACDAATPGVPEKRPRSQDADNNQNPRSNTNTDDDNDSHLSQSSSLATRGTRLRRPPPSPSSSSGRPNSAPTKPLKSALKSPKKSRPN